MMRLGHILACVVLISAVILSSCAPVEDPPVTDDPLDALIEKLQLTEEQVETIETGTGTLQLTAEQVDIISDPVEQLLNELEPLLDETRWQEVEDVFETLLTQGEADLEALAAIAADLHELEPVAELEVVTKLEKISEEVSSSDANQPLTSGPSEVTTIYTPGDTPPEIDEGDEDITLSLEWGTKIGFGAPDYGADANPETGGLGAYSQSWIGADRGYALLGIAFDVPADNTDVNIRTTLKHASSKVLVGPAAASGLSIPVQFDDYWNWRHEWIDYPFGWETGIQIICTALTAVGIIFPPSIPAVMYACATAEGVVYVIQNLDYISLELALLNMEDVEETEITYSAGSLDKGHYQFYIGLNARTCAVVAGWARAMAYGQVTKIEVTQTSEEEPINFPDPNLKAAIREEIGKPTGDIYPSDLDELINLNVQSRDITDLTGLEYATSLISLNSYFNPISDIQPLSNLPNLRYLYIRYSQISDIQPLSDLTSLIHLTLSGNQISDIQPLSDLTNLTYLSVENNQISDIQTLANLTSLTKLYLDNNPISDIQILSYLTSLTTLSLRSVSISDIETLANLTSLTTLYLHDNQISDIQPLSNLTNLTNLGFSYNQISDIQPLSNLTNLTFLSLHNNQIGDIQALSNLTSLTYLWASNNQISDIHALSNLTNIIDFTLDHNQISDISALVDNPGLGEGDNVYLRYNPLSDDSINIYIPQLEARGVTVDY